MNEWLFFGLAEKLTSEEQQGPMKLNSMGHNKSSKLSCVVTNKCLVLLHFT